VVYLMSSCVYGISCYGKRGQFVMHHGYLSELLGPHPPRFTTPFPVFILKVPGQPLRHPPKTRGHPGFNNKSKNHPRAHKRRSKPPQALSFRYPWDRVPRNHKTSKLCMLHTRPCDALHTHNTPTIHFDIPLLHITHNIPSPHYYKI
jgi:hypothetical protein